MNRATDLNTAPLQLGSCEKFGWSYKRDSVGTRCSASVLGLSSRTRSSASLPLNFSTASGGPQWVLKGRSSPHPHSVRNGSILPNQILRFEFRPKFRGNLLIDEFQILFDSVWHTSTRDD